jgi:hypothetical protein
MKTIHIDQDLDIHYQDEGPWRSYRLTARGSSFGELIDDAGIEEIDQDGGTLRCYSILDAEKEIRYRALDVIMGKARKEWEI